MFKGLKKPEHIWRELWKERIEKFSRWNYQCELKYSILIKEIKCFNGKMCLESGSGTGRVSLKLGQHGARPVLLDTSKKAIKFSKKLLYGQYVNADFVIGSIFNLPFKDSCLDLVWNEGLLQYFEFQKQQLAVSEFLRVLRAGGKVIVMVSNRKAWIYNLNRILSMKIKISPFGYEEPLSRKDFEKFSPKPKVFHSCGLLWQFTCIFIPKLSATLNFFKDRPHKNYIHRVSGKRDSNGMNFFVNRLLPILRFLHLLPYLTKIDKYNPGLIMGAVWAKA